MNKICVLLLALTLLAFDASAQSVQVIAKETRSPQTGGVTTGPKEHLKVGLVLSGGGARGIAHIGVLEWFERHRIPVDYVAGTSMGGLVGGMYATGMTPGEMREFLKKIDWDRAFGGGPSYEQLSFRRKEDRNSYQANVEVGLRNGIQIPPRLSSAHYIGLMIDRMMLPYANLSSFDELPIPFRCMATDFLSGQPVVLKDGSISSALRATMSIPGVFPPVERDGRVLVDGGLLNNIPTNVMRQMGPDILIAVDAGTPLGDVKTISTLLGILEQSVTVMTLENDRRNLRLADIIIAPELGNQSPLEFSDVDKLADLGYQAAEAKAAILKRFALDEADWQAYLARRQARRRASAPIADGLQIDGVDASAQEPIRKRLNGYIGRKLEPERLEADLTAVTGQGRYESLSYGFSQDANDPNKNLLMISVKKKSYAPPTMNFGIEIDGSDVNDINFTIGSRLTFYDIWRGGSEWRNDVKIGFRTLLSTEYFLPFGGDGLFVAPRSFYRRERQDLFQDGSRLAEYRAGLLGTGFDVGFTGRDSEARIGYEIGRLDASARVGDPAFSLDGMVSLARARWAYDGQDSATVPTRGVRLVTEGRWYFEAPGASGAFPQAEAKLSAFKRLSRGSLFVVGSGGTTFGEDAAPAQQFTLGGPFRMGAYDLDEFRGNRYALVSSGYLHTIYELSPLLGGKVYAAAWHDVGGAFDNFRSSGLRNAISAGIIADTRLGPFSLIGSFGEGGRGKIYFSFGKFF